ncbi:MAG: hypothetical protein Q7U75_15075 [Desulfobacterales bacterium]|nr:hypothetical protein [Desulfobacterales bacterium]
MNSAVLAPAQFDTLAFLAFAATLRGSLPQAISILDGLSVVDPDWEGLAVGRALALASTGNTALALRSLDTPANPGDPIQMGAICKVWLLQAQGQTGAVAAEVRRLARIHSQPASLQIIDRFFPGHLAAAGITT